MKIFIKEKIAAESYTKISFEGKNKEALLIVNGGKKTLEINLPGDLNWRQTTLIPRMIIFFAKKNGLKKIAIDWSDVEKMKLGEKSEVAEIFATNLEMANYEFVEYKEKPKEGWGFIDEVVIVSKKDAKLAEAFKTGQIIGSEINSCRNVSNRASCDLTPENFVKVTKKAIQGTKIKMKVLEEAEMKKLGMEAVLTVGRGSVHKPKFIILEYKNGGNKKPSVLIGKGVTFDSGGISIKPADGMQEMVMDMSGGSAVIFSLVAAAKLGLKKNIVGLVPAVENMPSGSSYKPGDVIKSMSGKTIEVDSTDAEGRIILADANTYAEKYDPEFVINVATLTGAACVALGERASAFFTKDEKLRNDIKECGEKSGDYVWELPLWDEYESEIKGKVADIINTRNRSNSRYGGAILGAMFVYQFAKKFKSWAHMDIAPRMTAAPDEFLSPGASGSPVRLLIRLLKTK